TLPKPGTPLASPSQLILTIFYTIRNYLFRLLRTKRRGRQQYRVVFVPPPGSPESAWPPPRPHTTSAGKGVYARDIRAPVGQGPTYRPGTVPPHPPLPGRGRAAAHTGPPAWPVPPHGTPVGAALSHGRAGRAGASAPARQRRTPGVAPLLVQLVE